MAYLLQFAGFQFPRTLRPDDHSVNLDLAEQERPRADGSILQIGRRKSRSLMVRGEITAPDAASLETTLDSLQAACLPGTVGQLFYGRDDRFFTAQVEGFSHAYSEGMTFGLLAILSITFKAGQPFMVSTTAATAALSVGTTSVTNAGNAPALPVWTITVNAAGTGPITLTNAATGETCSLGGPFAAGDIVILDRNAYTVTRNGVPAFGLLSGRIPQLLAGVSSIVLAAGGTATITSASAAYSPRFF